MTPSQMLTAPSAMTAPAQHKKTTTTFSIR